MANQLFQQARKYTAQALESSPGERQEAVAKAKNALSSAYANSTFAEQKQLAEMQEQLDGLGG
ncbi:DUF3813 domain-containing protein [Neobacillus piezotolerans]|uniref:DUF3813 domain-containing protein n=1 Tax=Neobacillus piezotolerans TaxID=2259171 RepID=A0A3D8GM52_9BACI|nr:DUF3813 domain-containing protein [Neobacillus piezotolerans]RDU35550.1 DUF3813 domain-containing protein [Neobacillus piezotolerans]